ncbi:MalY/PatB family protein [Dermatobacter hominis]|uniref:MalY/PatB family protein n=1 Tax=Dermatobacter hominis TaxID=2884263 RepID=UPI001D105513|nr:aminotransferase class I/II-fold pyridoxal phosphate-dependent enzyme [Dermatobacter hominis]UDY36326.1 aminotransferase class I/II-fold pyridoxal phosphate-dependent enzyme [Dermatobacter hominis]
MGDRTDRRGAAFDVDLDRLRRRRSVKWSLYGPDVLAAWVAEMDFDVAPPVLAAVRDAVDREDFGYPVADLSELTGSCAAHLSSSHGWDVAPERIQPVADVLGGIAGSLRLDVPDGAAVVVPTPAYPPQFEVVELAGRRSIEVPMVLDGDRFALDVDRIGEALAAGAGAVLLTNPHNPTGRAFGVDELQALAAVVERHGARVISDEVHAPLVLPGARHVPYAMVSDAAAAHTTTVVSVSKAWNVPGLRCAQVVASDHDTASRWRRRRVFEVAGPTSIGIAASVAAYRDGDGWRRELLEQLDENRALLVDLVASELPGVVLRPPEATYLAWLDCGSLGLDDPAATFLADGRVAVSDGPPFGAGNESMVRLNFGTSPSLLERIVVAMGAAVRSTRP